MKKYGKLIGFTGTMTPAIQNAFGLIEDGDDEVNIYEMPSIALDGVKNKIVHELTVTSPADRQ